MATEKDDGAGRGWKRLLIAAAIVSALLVAALAVSINYASTAFDSWSTVVGLLLALPPSIASAWFASARLCRLAGTPATFADCFWANALSVSVSLVAPGRLFEAVKPVSLNLTAGLPMARGFAAVALERLLDVGCLALLAALAVAGAAAQYAEGLREAAIVLAALLAAGVLMLGLLAAWPALAARVANRLPFGWLRNLAAEMVDTLIRVGNWRALLYPGLLSILVWAASYGMLLVIVQSVGVLPLSQGQVLFVFVAATLGLLVAIAPGGIGTYEGAMVLALGSFGYPVADALLIAILLRIANLLPAVAASAWFLSRGKVRLGDVMTRLRRRPETP